MIGEEEFNRLKSLGYFRDVETHAKDGKYFRVEVIEGETYVIDKRYDKKPTKGNSDDS